MAAAGDVDSSLLAAITDLVQFAFDPASIQAPRRSVVFSDDGRVENPFNFNFIPRYVRDFPHTPPKSLALEIINGSSEPLGLIKEFKEIFNKGPLMQASTQSALIILLDQLDEALKVAKGRFHRIYNHIAEEIRKGMIKTGAPIDAIKKDTGSATTFTR